MTDRRAIAIVRVSREGGRGDDLLSPDIQRGSITEYCERRGLTVVEWVEAIDESGSQERSAWWARLDAAVERIEEGEADAIIAWKYSRVARRRRRWATAVDRVEDAGGTIESATEGIDTTTAGGRFARGMLAEVGAFFADQTGEAWKETHANRLSRGLPANGKPRFGYVYDGDTKMHRPDPITGPVLGQAYTRYVAGESVYQLVRWLNGDGIRTVSGYGSDGGAWTDRSLRRVLDSGFGAGLLSVHDPECRCSPRARSACRRRTYLPGAHDPVIDQDTWVTYRKQRRERAVTRSSERSQYLLSGLPRCVAVLEDGSRCGGRMTGGQFGHAREPKFRCRRAKETGAHTGGYVTMRYLEQAVREWLERESTDLDAAAVRAEAEAAQVAIDLPAVKRQLADATTDLERATRRYLTDQIPEAVWPAIRADLEGRTQALQAKVARLSERRSKPLPQQIATTLLADWDTLGVEHRRAMLRELIDRIEVEPGRVELDDRGYWRSGVTIIPMGDYRH